LLLNVGVLSLARSYTKQDESSFLKQNQPKLIFQCPTIIKNILKRVLAHGQSLLSAGEV